MTDFGFIGVVLAFVAVAALFVVAYVAVPCIVVYGLYRIVMLVVERWPKKGRRKS